MKNTFRSYAAASTVFGRHRPAQELQIHIGQRHPDPGDQRPGTVRTNQAPIASMHCRLPTSQTARSVKDGSNEKEDHRHNMHVSKFGAA